LDKVFIILDKLDKIGLDGVSEELQAAGFAAEAVTAYLMFFRVDSGGHGGLEQLDAIATKLASSDGEAAAAVEELRTIMTCVQALHDEAVQGTFQIIFDPSLVRGMGYYTGPIFEVAAKEFASSIGGGGRYDKLVGNFTNLQVPACGLSLGFERIISILMEKNFVPPSTGSKIAFFAERGLDNKGLCAMLQEAAQARRDGATVHVAYKNKNSRHQIEQLEKDGYTEFRTFSK